MTSLMSFSLKAEFCPQVCSGFLFRSELDALEKVISNPKLPMLAIVGGSKVSTKLTILDSLSDKVDQLILGGGIANTLSRFSMDICLYMSQNFDFIAFLDSLVTGSSIMPHNKNPDVFELIRGKSNKIQALQIEMTLITNNLPSGYHRDFQLLKENMINLIEEMKTILEIFNYSIQQIKVKKIDFLDEKYTYLSTVDSINNLVMKGLSFREAYQQIGDSVTNGTYEYTNAKEPHDFYSLKCIDIRV